MPYRLDLADAGEDASDRLIELGALDLEIAANGDIAALMPDSISVDEVTRALVRGVVSTSAALGRDDQSVWVLTQRPIAVGRVRILPAESDATPGSIRLIDAPAFGTGLHPTTALCIEILGELVDQGRPEPMLDVGTGSGVLSLAALTLGTPRAVGIDVDEGALRIAAENARLNGFADRLKLLHGGPEVLTARWPLVLANVLASPLIEMAPSLVRRIAHHGHLVLSGIPMSVAQDVERAYRGLGMRRLDAKSRGGWVALVMQASW